MDFKIKIEPEVLEVTATVSHESEEILFEETLLNKSTKRKILKQELNKNFEFIDVGNTSTDKLCEEGIVKKNKTRNKNKVKNTSDLKINDETTNPLDNPLTSINDVQVSNIINNLPLKEENNSHVEYEEFINLGEQYEIRNEFGEIIDIYQPAVQRMETDTEAVMNYNSNIVLNQTSEYNLQNTSTSLIDCKFCEKQFLNENALKTHTDFVHLTVYHKSPQFKCKFCSKTFNMERKLKAHIKGVHFKEKITLTKCQFCQISFLNENLLNRHVQSNHLEVQNQTKKDYLSVKCVFCKKAFSGVASLQTHIVNVHVKKESLVKQYVHKEHMKIAHSDTKKKH